MKRLLIIYSLLLVVFSSCQNNKEKVQGAWIEKDNFHAPTTLQIEDFFFRMTSTNYTTEKLYHIQNDTFYVNGVNQIYKSIIKLKDNELEIYDLDSLSPTLIFERNLYENTIDYFNSKKKTSIELPRLELGIKGSGYNYQNSLFADDIDGKLVLYFNGDLHELNDSSYLVLTQSNSKAKCQLFIDKNITVGNLKTISTELRKAKLNAIAYAITDSSGLIKNIGKLLPPIDSISGMPMPPPMKAGLDRANSIIQVTPEYIRINKESVSRYSFKETIKNHIKLNNKVVLRVLFHKQLAYESYISYYADMQAAYFELRNEYSKANFNVDDYLDLEYEQVRNVRQQYPMKIHEVDEEEMKKYN